MRGVRPQITLQIEGFLNACAEWCEDHWMGGILLRVVIVLAYFVLRFQDIGRIGLWVMLLLAAFIVPRLLMWRREREINQRFLKGCCTNCGYDLRASPQRCPECGQEVPRPFSRPELAHHLFSHKRRNLPYDPHKT
jgi:hypothetical protein